MLFGAGSRHHNFLFLSKLALLYCLCFEHIYKTIPFFGTNTKDMSTNYAIFELFKDEPESRMPNLLTFSQLIVRYLFGIVQYLRYLSTRSRDVYKTASTLVNEPSPTDSLHLQFRKELQLGCTRLNEKGQLQLQCVHRVQELHLA